MAFALRQDAERETAISAANDPLQRFFDQPKISYAGQENDENFSEFGFWRRCRTRDSQWFSAIGAYFAQELSRALNVPIGIVGCNFGGVSASAWLPENALAGVPALRVYIDEYNNH
jgi:sialate O-acetylesterase